MKNPDGATLDDLMRNADLALYAAKDGGRGQVVPYRPDLSTRYHEKLALEQDLRAALDRGEFELAYQPIVDPRSGRALSCEALLRWHHPERGIVPPSEFIPLAEANGLIVPIGEWALRTACVEATRWPADVRVAVNISVVQFRRAGELVATVHEALRDSGLPPSRLEVEITESVLIDDTATTLALVEQLRAEGVGVSLDDFGTGFSSLAYLSDFPFSKIKVDRKFSQDLERSPRTRGIIQGIAQITRRLGIELVAEGVESREQLVELHGLGINAIQGYVFSRPVPAEDLRGLIAGQIRPDLVMPRSRKAASAGARDAA